MIFQFYFSLFLPFFVSVRFLSFLLGNRILVELFVKRITFTIRRLIYQIYILYFPSLVKKKRF